MLTDEVIDEDIEALLYAQIYYGKSDINNLPDCEEANAVLNKESTVEIVNGNTNKEYCEKLDFNSEELQKGKESEPAIDSNNKTDSINNSGHTEQVNLNSGSKSQDQEIHTTLPTQYSEISTTSTSTNPSEHIITQIPILTTPSNTSGSVLNNITINQYIYPGEQFLDRLKDYRQNIIWSRQCEKDLKRFQQGKLSEKEFFSILKQRQAKQQKGSKKQEQIWKAFFTKQQKIVPSEIICLSDSDNSDIEIIGIDIIPPEKTPTINKSGIIMSHNDDDGDEIIYVPPPPVPVIDVEDESCSDEEEVQQKATHDLDDASNDFLTPANTSENFNFSLHGAEFQDGEFVRPVNPTDVYETESSTSTSDFNKESSRNFSNTVKTIVFNEVDFPREDIFEGNDLEKFGELIAPAKEGGSIETESRIVNNSLKDINKAKPRTSSESSSECDYVETHSNLPNLSPMICTEPSPRKSRTKDNLNKSSNFPKENDCIIDVDSPSSFLRKRSKRLSLACGEDNAAKRKSKKKKKKSDKLLYSPISEGEFNLESPVEEIQSSFVISSTPLSESIIDQLVKKKGKKKKKQMKNMDDNFTMEDIGKRKSKRRKSGSKSANDDTAEIEELNKKKARKHKQKQATTEDTSTSENPQTLLSDNQKKYMQKEALPIKNTETIINAGESNNQGVEPYEIHAGEKVVVETQEEEDVILIEQDVPIHTIESSSESEDDILTLNDVGNELELANITSHVDKADEDKNLDKFDIGYIQSKMSDDPQNWKILPSDRNNMNIPKKGPRCNRCRQIGHLALHCTNKSRIPICNLCGSEGHQEPRCPNRICFTCAQPGYYSTVWCNKCSNQMKSTCYVCQLPGHSGKYCPDLWRRYYLTTEEGPIVKPKRNSMNLKPRCKLWCSGCATKGHLEFECTSCKWIREYPVSSPRVFKFNDIYESEKRVGFKKKLQNTNAQVPNKPSHTVAEKQNIASSDKVQEYEPAQQLPAVSDVQIDEIPSSTITTPKEPQNNLIQSPPPKETTLGSKEALNEPPASNEAFVKKPLSYRKSSDDDQSQNTFSGRKSRPRAKLNPVSMCKRPKEFTKYTPYQSVLNPYSVLGSNNSIPPLMDLPPPTNLGLYNTTPSNVIIQQLSNLINCAQAVRNMNHNSNNFFQFNPQLPCSNNYTDFTRPFPGDQHFNYAAPENRHDLDMPYTITREPSARSDYINCNPQYNQRISKNKNSGPKALNSGHEGFLSLNPGPSEIKEPFKPAKRSNVEEVTMKKFLEAPAEDLNEFLSSEIDKLTNIRNLDAKFYKKKLNNIDQLQKIDMKTNAVKKQMYFHFKHINMFLFGVQKLADGKKHLDFLRNFVCSPGRNLHDGKRNALLEAYGYIFGGEHRNFSYRKHLNALSVGQKHKRS